MAAGALGGEVRDGSDARVLLVPGAGGSGPHHWDHLWEASDAGVERVVPPSWTEGPPSAWVEALEEHVRRSPRPTVLVAHSMGGLVVCHWAARTPDPAPVMAALIVAPADVEGVWAPDGSLYCDFRPVPLAPLPFPSLLAASTNDPFLSIPRARQFARAWGADLHIVGALGHVGSASGLGEWAQGRALLSRAIAAGAEAAQSAARSAHAAPPH